MTNRLQENSAGAQQGREGARMRVSVMELVAILVSSAHWILISLAAGLAVGALVCLFQSPAYRAEATLLPEEVSSRSGLMANVSERISFWPVSTRSTQVFYSTILRSRAVAEMVSERLGLAEWLEWPTSRHDRERLAVDKLQRSVTVTEMARDRFYTGGGLITISIEGHEPVRSADIANTYAHVLDEYLTENAATSASRIRRFLERRLAETNRELQEAQSDLQEFQERHGAINIDEQATATIQLLSELEARRVGLSVEKVAEEERYSPAHSSVRMLQAKIDALQQVIDRLTYSREEKVPVERDGTVEFFVPLQMIPELSFEAGRRLLALKSKEGIVTLFTTRLEQAKIDEASNLPSVCVLDLAQGGYQIRPRWKMNLVVGVLIGLVVGCLGVWGRHYGTRIFGDVAKGVEFAAVVEEVQGWGQAAKRYGSTALGSVRLGFRHGAGDGPDDDVGNG